MNTHDTDSDYDKTNAEIHAREGAQARYQKFLKRCTDKGLDPQTHKANFCADCGNYPAYQPRVLVANLRAGTSDTYHLDLPPLCDLCNTERGFTRYNFLVPKTDEIQGPTAMMKAHLERIKPWMERVRAKAIQDLVDEGMPEDEAKSMLGVE